MYKIYGVREHILGGNFKFQGIEGLPGYELNAVQLTEINTKYCNVNARQYFA